MRLHKMTRGPLTTTAAPYKAMDFELYTVRCLTVCRAECKINTVAQWWFNKVWISGSLMFGAVILFFIPACGRVFHLIWPTFLSNTTRERDEKGSLSFTTCFLKASCLENLFFFFQLLNLSFLHMVVFVSLGWRQVNYTFPRLAECVCVSTVYT